LIEDGYLYAFIQLTIMYKYIVLLFYQWYVIL